MPWSLRAGFLFSPSSVKRRHHMLDLRVLLERVHRHVLAIPALLVAAVRHLVEERDVGVDPDGAELELAGHAQGAADVARPDGRREAVVDAVRPRERLVLARERLDGDDRPEHLALDDLVVLADARDDGRLDEEALPAPGVPAERHLAAPGHGAVEEADDALL